MTTALQTASLSSPIGDITLATHQGRLCALGFTDRWPRLRIALERRFGSVALCNGADAAAAARQLQQYFAGDIEALAALDVDPGGTPFQQRVWAALHTIKPGRTISYRELAQMIDAPAAVRAVGTANGANPISIVIPCHRVIGADGHLVGYAGGIERKRWLLTHEGTTLL